MRTSTKYELHWVKAQTLDADTYHDEEHGTFDSLAATQDAVQNEHYNEDVPACRMLALLRKQRLQGDSVDKMIKYAY